MEQKPRRFEGCLYVLKRLALIQIGVLAAVGLLCLVAGWHSVNEISMALLAVGVIIFAIGPFSMMGGWGTTRNWGYLYTRTLEGNTQQHRMSQDKQEINRSVGL
ncbi:MAG: hypothetical protein JW910_02940, partial [Anaerolineae bacterium]|nr:hypothetical protein [Anaerolineae bacterium]